MKRKTNEIFCRTKTTTQNKKQKTNLKKIQHRKLKKPNKMDLIKYQKGETMVLASNLYFDRSPLRVVETKSMT
jgi:hypothetical protein